MSATAPPAKVDDTAAPATKKKLAPAGGMLNLQSRDPFAEADSLSHPGSGAGTPQSEEPGGSGGKIHIRVQQRNGRKMITSLQGLDKAYDAKKLLKAFKKEFACNGKVVSSEDASDDEDKPKPATTGAIKPNFGQVIQLQGDQRVQIRQFLIDSGIVSAKEAKEKIQVHGH